MSIPDSILQAACKCLEKSGADPLCIHPGRAGSEDAMARARKVMETKLTWKEADEIESAFNMEGGLLFEIAYTMGFCDGVKTNQALAELKR
ncbi:MAG TPA: hypothetical protein GX531_07675 [Methanothermobacter sp.]|nr:hypothetical protein [Methanothermobacter sp.]